MSVLLAMCPSLIAATRANACVLPPATPASYTWNFQNEANQTFRTILDEAETVRYFADQLEFFPSNGITDWWTHGDMLMQLRTSVNEIGGTVCRLEAIRRVVAPWQQKTIDEIISTITLMADNTQDAITFGNNNQLALWKPVYADYLKNIYNESSKLTKSLNQAVQFARVGSEYNQLKKDVGAKSTS
ncbi:MAG TPA: hypothetical protein VLY04_11970 [Bryobacteraceae bacterium]|nr:hypothetical protein [Bryobacteraceae bacterium]